jgi:acyl-CoA synthetase (AMP-forming)/AMP-acid ligase II
MPATNSPTTVLLLDALTPPTGATRTPATAVQEHFGVTFLQTAQRNPGAPAITSTGGCWSYDDLQAAALSIAESIRTLPAYSPGARVVLLLPNSVEYIAAFLGISLADAVIVPVPPRAEAGQIDHVIQSTEAIAVIASSTTTARHSALAAAPGISLLGRSIESFDADAIQSAGDDLAAIFFTAGSTGTPKGVMLSHRNLLANARSIQEYLEITPAERPLCVLPFHHAFGNSVLTSHLLAGAEIVLAGNTAFPETLVEAIAKYECTSLSGVPDLFRVMLERTSLGKTPLRHLRRMAVAGGALRHDLAVELSKRIAPAKLYVMYGQTEATARLSYVPPAELELHPSGGIGRGIPGVTLQVADADGNPAGVGEVGELRATGPNVMLGYWRDPDATAERIRGGWLYTGDLASMDAAGWVTIRGRQSALVKIAGFRVHPAELEDFAVRRLGASHAVSVPFESPTIGARLALFLKTSSTLSRANQSELIARCRAELPRHLVPEFIELVDEFPLNHALKIDRPLLVRMAEQGSVRRTDAA